VTRNEADDDAKRQTNQASSVKKILILAATTGYQIRMFSDAAERVGVKLVFASDRCDQLDDPWWDGAIPIKFHQEEQSVAAIVAALAATPVDGVLCVGDRPAVIGAYAARLLGLPAHPPAAAVAARDKRLTRERLRAGGLFVPRFQTLSIDADPSAVATRLTWPVVVKPAALAGSRGVIRADDAETFVAAFNRVRRLLQSPDVRVLRDSANDEILVEGFVEGREYAVEGVLEQGALHVLAIFDKPDPLDGPFFEETIYTTPSGAPDAEQQAIRGAVADAARALGLYHGPIHAECRVNRHGVFVLEVAARPIGGLCARVLRFSNEAGDVIPLEELLLRHAIGETVTAWTREPDASGVMMIPIPREGVYRDVQGVDAARAVRHVEDVHITAKPDQHLVPLPEGASYLGFIFARAQTAVEVERSLRLAHAELQFNIDRALPVA
jgi:biotin carboxylase